VSCERVTFCAWAFAVVVPDVPQENWTYTLIFSVPSAALDGFERVWLVADGIDTVANISVNGERPFMADNMYRRYVWDVTQHITSSTNTLLVVFRSAISAANASAAQGYHGEPSLGTPPNCPPPVQNGFCHVNFLRKSPCSFSWDWGPAFATQVCGLLQCCDGSQLATKQAVLVLDTFFVVLLCC